MNRTYLAVVICCLTIHSQAAEFRSLAKITDGAFQYRLSRNSNAQMAVDSHDRLHVTYWSGGIDTRPDAPSRVFYRSWSNRPGWTDQIVIDDSYKDGYGRVGGRHSSLAIAPDDSVWVAWADHRHCTETGSWIDNTEIYADVRPSGGAFSSTDLRLTTTAAGTMGDNGYTPKILCDSQGRLQVAWHDYSANANVSDVYLKVSGADRVFDLVEPLSSMRLTDSGAGAGPEYTIVDMAIAPDGKRHLVWTGGESSQVDLFYGELAEGATSVSEQVLAAGGTDYYDPPHVAVSQAGDVWIAFADCTGGAAEEIRLLRKRAGQTSFDAPVTIAANPARQYYPSLAVDSSNRVHLAWVDQRDGSRQVYYGVYDPAQSQLLQETKLTVENKLWSRPSLHIDANDDLYLLCEEVVGISAGEIWFTTTLPEPVPTRAVAWEGYR